MSILIGDLVRLCSIYAKPTGKKPVGPTARVAVPRLAGDFFEHLRVGRKLFHEHEQTLNRFLGLVPGETATDQIDFLQFPRLQQQFFAPRAGDGHPGALCMQRSRDRSFCCGGGGLMLFYEPKEEQRMGVKRIQMAADAGANVIVTACPFCMANIEDAIKVAAPRPLEQKQFADVPSISAEEVREMLKSGAPVQIIDTRPKHYTSKAQDIMEGAVWRDPERLDEWISSLSKTEPVVTFCVYGFHIGCETASTLRKAGFDARYMSGGHFAWKAIKGPVRLFE